MIAPPMTLELTHEEIRFTMLALGLVSDVNAKTVAAAAQSPEVLANAKKAEAVLCSVLVKLHELLPSSR